MSVNVLHVAKDYLIQIISLCRFKWISGFVRLLNKDIGLP